jgi:hypothetical protein
MPRKTRRNHKKNGTVIKAPAYPFTGQTIFQDLRASLSKDLGFNVTLERMADLMGTSTSKSYYWFRFCRHANIAGFMCLLENLSPAARNAFLDGRFRTLATLTDPRLVLPAGTYEKLLELLNQHKGLTFIRGGTEFSRASLLFALGHTYARQSRKTVVGLDLRRPDKFVPIVGVMHIDQGLDANKVKESAHKAWTRVLTSRSRLVLLNDVWSTLPEFQGDILSLAKHRHLIIADRERALTEKLKNKPVKQIHTLTVKNLADGRILVNYRRPKNLTKCQQM